jgi:hypothetical protein
MSSCQKRDWLVRAFSARAKLAMGVEGVLRHVEVVWITAPKDANLIPACMPPTSPNLTGKWLLLGLLRGAKVQQELPGATKNGRRLRLKLTIERLGSRGVLASAFHLVYQAIYRMRSLPVDMR